MSARPTAALLALFLPASLALAGAAAPDRWQAAWVAPPIGWEPKSKGAYPDPIENQTVRQTIRIAAAGERIRIRLTNELGAEPLRIGAASVAIEGGAPVPLRFSGAQSILIPTGAPAYSDPLPFPVSPGTQLVLSVYYPDKVTPAAHAQKVRLSKGDTTRNAGQGTEARSAGLASSVEVPGTVRGRVLVAFGDSITEGAGASDSARTSWPAQVSAALAARRDARCWTVVNAGISGNRLLHDGRGPNALARFDRDVLSVPGVTHVVLLEGINDIGAGKTNPAQAVSADQVIAAYRQLIDRGHARGLKVLGGTLLPFVGAAYQDAAGEAKRVTVNQWIRSSGAFDGVIDFDAATRDPAKRDRLVAGFEIGDHLHPNDAGYTAMARAATPVIARQGCPR
ncbi:SGNH/GDSL hydrolase family protein [Sphingomonas gei]|uniref:SGNH/GDSL hydrolase family protein n=1 Tax=Sphingomonas gei TaxID=1395960 RepID=A0A4S1XKL4_9SPHN|nr:SGNH/GDSL hydrolase family protein [Sphingomonas gei]TGX55716.1 SGNH/GDSL hydrolase family protein [Sphingomonas gei]